MIQILMVVYNTIQNDARVIRAAEALATSGYNITVISCNSDNNYSNPFFKNVLFTNSSKGPLLLVSFWIFVLYYLTKHRKDFDVLYLHDYFMPIIGKIHSFFSKKKWIYDAHELLIQRRNYKKSLREKLFFYLEKIAINKADLVVCANTERLRITRKIYKLNNAVSVSNIADLSKNITTIFSKDIIVYQGVLNQERRVDLFIKVLTYLPEQVSLKLIGGGNIDFYKKLAEDLGVSERVIFTGRIPYNDLLKESLECKVGIVSYKLDDLNNLYCSPNKLYEYIQCNIPIIATPQPFLVKIINKYKIGEIWDIKKADLVDLAHKILKIIEGRDNYLQQMPLFNSIYNNTNEMKELVTAMNNLLKKDK